MARCAGMVREVGARKAEPADGGFAPLGGQQTHSTRDGDFLVRSVPGEGARKPYRCPGCQQVIPVGTPHLVVWPAPGGAAAPWGILAVDGRRHWHTSCWQRWSTRGGAAGP